ncbi:MAG: hypothetical protein V1835_03265 [Candidatus Micrarchaeota archaeon]
MNGNKPVPIRYDEIHEHGTGLIESDPEISPWHVKTVRKGNITEFHFKKETEISILAKAHGALRELAVSKGLRIANARNLNVPPRIEIFYNKYNKILVLMHSSPKA